MNRTLPKWFWLKSFYNHWCNLNIIFYRLVLFMLDSDFSPLSKNPFRFSSPSNFSYYIFSLWKFLPLKMLWIYAIYCNRAIKQSLMSISKAIWRLFSILWFTKSHNILLCFHPSTGISLISFFGISYMHPQCCNVWLNESSFVNTKTFTNNFELCCILVDPTYNIINKFYFVAFFLMHPSNV